MGERHNITMEEGDCQETDPCCLAILDLQVGVIFKLYMCVFTLELGIIHNIMKGVWVHFQGKQLCHFHCCLPNKLRSFHKGKNLLPSGQFFTSKSRHNFGTTSSSR